MAAVAVGRWASLVLRAASSATAAAVGRLELVLRRRQPPVEPPRAVRRGPPRPSPSSQSHASVSSGAAAAARGSRGRAARARRSSSGSDSDDEAAEGSGAPAARRRAPPVAMRASPPAPRARASRADRAGGRRRGHLRIGFSARRAAAPSLDETEEAAEEQGGAGPARRRVPGRHRRRGWLGGRGLAPRRRRRTRHLMAAPSTPPPEPGRRGRRRRCSARWACPPRPRHGTAIGARGAPASTLAGARAAGAACARALKEALPGAPMGPAEDHQRPLAGVSSLRFTYSCGTSRMCGTSSPRPPHLELAAALLSAASTRSRWTARATLNRDRCRLLLAHPAVHLHRLLPLQRAVRRAARRARSMRMLTRFITFAMASVRRPSAAGCATAASMLPTSGSMSFAASASRAPPPRRAPRAAAGAAAARGRRRRWRA